MDLTFHCPHCNQELAVDMSAAGQVIQCPTCHAEITVPVPAGVVGEAPAVAEGEVPADGSHHGSIASSAAAKIERHFSVPVHDRPAEVLIQKVEKKEEEATVEPGQRKKMKLKVIRHTDCIEVGHDRYEEFVGNFLNKVGEENIISITPLSYTHIDIATQKILTDFAVQVIYRV